MVDTLSNIQRKSIQIKRDNFHQSSHQIRSRYSYRTTMIRNRKHSFLWFTDIDETFEETKCTYQYRRQRITFFSFVLSPCCFSVLVYKDDWFSYIDCRCFLTKQDYGSESTSSEQRHNQIFHPSLLAFWTTTGSKLFSSKSTSFFISFCIISKENDERRNRWIDDPYDNYESKPFDNVTRSSTTSFIISRISNIRRD